MRYEEIIAESASKKLFLSLQSDKLNDDFYRSGKVGEIKGISGSRRIWQDFGPNLGYDIFVVMNEDDVMRNNDVDKIDYTNVNDLLADNSKIFARLHHTSIDGRMPADNVIEGVFKSAGFETRYGTVGAAKHIIFNLKTGKGGVDGFEELKLNSPNDYRRLYLAAAKEVQDEAMIEVLSDPSVNDRIVQAIVDRADIYSDEKEWMVSGLFTVPKSSQIMIALDSRFIPKNPDKNMFWNQYDDAEHEKIQRLISLINSSPLNIKIVDKAKVANSLSRAASSRY